MLDKSNLDKRTTDLELSIEYKIKIGNQTNKVLIVQPNELDAEFISPNKYLEWNFAPRVTVQVLAQDLSGQLLRLGNFSYDNVFPSQYADIHVYESPVWSQKANKEYYFLYYYLASQNRIFSFAPVEKAVWDALP